MMSQKKQIIFVAPYLASFVRNDLDILSSSYAVKVNCGNWKKKYLIPFTFIRQLFFLLRYISSSHLIIVHFGGYWALLPALIGKMRKVPVFIVLHGTDCAKNEEIGYGNLRKKLLKWVLGKSYHLASCLLPVSYSLIETRNTYMLKEKLEGLKNYFPTLNTPVCEIHNGLNFEFWNPNLKEIKEEHSCIATMLDDQFILKGGDLIIELARKRNDLTFYIAGTNGKMIGESKPSNVKFLGLISKFELREYYQKSKFHFQLSAFEGFGLALCEAMLCECIPIGSSVNMIPEIIGDTGFVLKKRNVELLDDLLQQAELASSKEELGKAARKRVTELFSLERRKERLLEVLKTF